MTIVPLLTLPRESLKPVKTIINVKKNKDIGLPVLIKIFLYVKLHYCLARQDYSSIYYYELIYMLMHLTDLYTKYSKL